MNRILAQLERLLWYALLATLGWQTRLILWQADRVFVEWRSASLWLTDVGVLALIALALARGWRPRIQGRDRWLVVFFALAALSLTQALAPAVGLIALARLAECILLYLCVRQWVVPHHNADHAALAFVAGSVGEAVLAVWQSVIQHDMGLRWLGETLLEPTMRGVAVFIADHGDRILRAYGTLPHPNVLAVQLALALWVLWWLYLRHATRRVHDFIWAVAGALMLWGLYVTYSRTVIALWLAATVAFAVVLFRHPAVRSWPNVGVVRERTRRALAVIALVTVVFGVTQWQRVGARAIIHASDEAVQYRLDFARDSLGSGGGRFLHINWLGVGLGNFTTWLAHTQPWLPDYQVQPAHNIFLMAYAETGVLGLGVWLWWLWSTAVAAWHRHERQPILRLAVAVVIGTLILVGMFDHLFWTLQQGRLLWWISLAVLA